MRRNFKKIALTIFVLTMTFSPITTFVQTATFRGQQGRISRPVKAILSGRL